VLAVGVIDPEGGVRRGLSGARCFSRVTLHTSGGLPYTGLELNRVMPAFDPYYKWLGNTPTVAHKHYLTVTDEHFATATTIGDKRGTQTPVLCRSDSQEKTRTVHQVPEYASFSEVVGILENAQVAEEGLEPPTRG